MIKPVIYLRAPGQLLRFGGHYYSHRVSGESLEQLAACADKEEEDGEAEVAEGIAGAVCRGLKCTPPDASRSQSAAARAAGSIRMDQ